MAGSDGHEPGNDEQSAERAFAELTRRIEGMETTLSALVPIVTRAAEQMRQVKMPDYDLSLGQVARGVAALEVRVGQGVTTTETAAQICSRQQQHIAGSISTVEWRLGQMRETMASEAAARAPNWRNLLRVGLMLAAPVLLLEIAAHLVSRNGGTRVELFPGSAVVEGRYAAALDHCEKVAAEAKATVNCTLTVAPPR